MSKLRAARGQWCRGKRGERRCAPRIQELFPQHQVLAVPEAPERLPRRLKSPLLDEVSMQREPPLLVEPALLDSAPVRHLLDNLLDALNLPALQRRIKHKPLEVVEFVG